MNKKILILGGDGMAGDMIKTYLQEKGLVVFATTRRNENAETFYYDVALDYKKLEDIIEKIKPDFVVNCIGVLNQFAEDNKSVAVLINSFLPHYADLLSTKFGFKFIHISTDCVYSGNKGDYIEADLPDAASFYGRSKSLGEVNNDSNVTFRTSIIGPDINEKGIGLFNWFMQQKGQTKGFNKVEWTGVTTLQLAKAVEKSLDFNITGLFHLVNNKKINKYDLLQLFKEHMKKKIEIIEDPSVVSSKTLINTRTDFNFSIPSYEDMIMEMSEWIENHKEKYGQIIANKNI